MATLKGGQSSPAVMMVCHILHINIPDTEQEHGIITYFWHVLLFPIWEVLLIQVSCSTPGANPDKIVVKLEVSIALVLCKDLKHKLMESYKPR